MTLLAFPLLLAFWVFVCWRVRVERGVVHAPPLSPYERLARAFRLMFAALGEALYPIVRVAAARLDAWNAGMEEINRRLEENAAEVAAAVAPLLQNLPPGYTVGFDTTPLLEEGGTE